MSDEQNPKDAERHLAHPTAAGDRRRRKRGPLTDRRKKVRKDRDEGRGMTLLWAAGLMTVLIGISVLGLDVGRAMLAKGQLQDAVDAAALYGVTGLDTSPHEARRRVRESLAENAVLGRVMNVEDSQITFGAWDPREREFLPLPLDEAGTATALRVEVLVDNRSNEGFNPIFAQLLGDDSVEMSVRTTVTRGEPFDLEIDSRSSPYLAGMPEGSSVPYTAPWGYQPEADHPLRKGEVQSKNKTYKRGEKAPPHDLDPYGKFKDKPVAPGLAKKVWTESGDESRPLEVAIDVYPGQVLYFRDVNGGTGDYASGGQEYSLDGNTYRPNIAQVPVNGFDTTRAPLNAMMGVFLTDDAPTETAARDGLDFSTEHSRNQLEVRPETKQIFFIGDGMANENVGYPQLQKIVVPDGATRLFLGVQDEYGWWWDNFGSVRTTLFEGNPTIVE